MPKLGLFLLDWCIKGSVFFHLNNEADLCRVAEIRHSKTTHFLDEGFSRQFQFILTLFYQVLYLIGLKLHYWTDAKFVGPLSLVEVAQNILHIGYLFTDPSPVWRQIDEKLVVRVLVLNIVQRHYTVTLVASTTTCIIITAAESLLLWYHSLFELIKNWIQFPSGLFNVGHWRLKLISRVEATQIMRWLVIGVSWEGRGVDVTWQLALACIQTFEGAICFLLRQEAAKWSVAHSLGWCSPFSTLKTHVIWITFALEIVIGLLSLWWHVVIGRSHGSDILSPNVEETELSQIIDQEMAKTNTFSRLLKSILVPMNLG